MTVAGSYGRTMAKREFATPGVPLTFTTNSYAANAEYRLGQRLNLQVSASRSVKPSNRPGKVYDVSTFVEGVAAYDLGSRYTVEFGHRRATNNSNVDTVPGARPVVTRSRNDITHGAARFAQSDRLSWELDLQYDKRKTNLPQFNYSSTRVGLRTTVNF